MAKVKRVLVEAASGRLVSVPEDRLESWQKRQAEIKADLDAGRKPTLTPEEEQMKERLVRRILESRERAQEKRGSEVEPDEEQ